jgi:fumarate hydratase, class II
MSCGPHAGLAELIKESRERAELLHHARQVDPTPCEALAMIDAQVMANDVAVGYGGARRYLEMNVYKPLMIIISPIQ